MSESLSTLSSRIRQRLSELEMSQADLARKTGMTPAAVNTWIKGGVSELKADSLLSAAKALQVLPQWLARGVGPKTLKEEGTGKGVEVFDDEGAFDETDEYVSIPEYDEYEVCMSAGSGVRSDTEVPDSAPVVYRLSWFRQMGVKPENAKRFTVKGDSMEPTLCNGDKILVDVAQNDPKKIRDGGVYAVRYGENLKVKRLRRRLNGLICLISDNPAYEPEEVKPEDSEDFAIIGKVIERSSTSSL